MSNLPVFLGREPTVAEDLKYMEYDSFAEEGPRTIGTPDPERLQRDTSHYLPGKIFLVDNCLFQIPMHYLSSESEVFLGMTEIPLPADGSAEGMSDDHPIRLDGVSKQDFRQLLKVLCPRKAYGPAAVLSFGEWTSVLKLADLWCMDAVREHAISVMSKLTVDPVEKVVVARTYHVDQWLIPAFNEILQRANTLTEHDVDRLGLSTALRLVAIRERLVQDYRGIHTLTHARQAVNLDFTSAIISELPECKNVKTHFNSWGSLTYA